MTTAYAILAPNRYLERFGLDFEDFAVGQRYRHRPGVTITQQDNLDEALDTQNAAMVHYDAHYSAQTAFKRPIMVSTVTLQRLVGMTSKTFGKRGAITGFREIALTSPIFGGDTIYCDTEILEVAPGDADKGVLTVRTLGFKADGTQFAKITYQTEVWKRGRHPEDRARGGALPRAEGARFAAYREDAGVLVELTGFFFEDAQAGETFVHYPRRTFTRAEAMEHAWRALDLSPQFHDAPWIEAHQGGRYRIPETFVIACVTALTTRTFGRVVANLGWTDVKLAPVYDGDTVEVESTIVEKRESKSRPNEGIFTVDTLAKNLKGEPVCSYRRNLLVYKRDAETPYAASGY